jgi:hypothetical protein
LERFAYHHQILGARAIKTTMMKSILVLLLIVCTFARPSYAALIPPSFANAVVAIGFIKTITEAGKPPVSEWITIGTGFFYGAKVKDDPDPTKQLFETYLVTARHVVEGYLKDKKGDLQIRVNPKDGTSRGREFNLKTNPAPGETSWFYHPDKNVDIAIIRINFNMLKEQGFDAEFIADKSNAATVATMKEIGVSAGDGIFILGFPLNLDGVERSYIIVRQGIIAMSL